LQEKFKKEATMTRLASKLFFVLGVGILFPFSIVRGQDLTIPGKLEQKNLVRTQEAVKHLIGQAETLHEDVIEHLDSRKEVVMYRQSEAVLVQLAKFEASLKPELERKRLYEEFDHVERKLNELLKGVRALGPGEKTLQRQAMRLEVAIEDVYFNISVGDTTPDRIQKVIERQTRTLDIAAKDLNRTAKYALAGVPGRAVALDAISNLAEASGKCHKSLASGAKINDLRGDFAALSNAWLKVIDQMEELSSQDEYYLLRSASRIDLLYGRLHQLLGLKGKCPRLTIRS
jgi:hypothetical protein